MDNDNDDLNKNILVELNKVIEARGKVLKSILYRKANELLNHKYQNGNKTIDNIKELFNDVSIDCSTKYTRSLDRIALVLGGK